ncbi:MAG: hypothetical protein A3E01_12685 [Gammaproteobacteria bacterium RIFCSPHIGHO2_12_FULL_63_22]|nr:MAG: hypothetical protein A3E01_12685 [Gammaproteobacteria bacterium RIFCSPHIGHO2_12_FULL_63_22]
MRAARLMMLAFACLATVACGGDVANTEKALLLPGLDKTQGDVDSILLHGAGNRSLVSLQRQGGTWRVAERNNWPADAGRISQYLFVLSQARRMEAKTADPKLYSRLGVEPIDSVEAKGAELTLSGKGVRARMLIGNEHPRLDGYYVRVDGEAGTWLTDLPVYFDPDPRVWLDRRLVDVPLARIARVRISGAGEKPFSLSHREDRFRLDDAPAAAMRDSYQGDVLASALDQLHFEDLAIDAGDTPPIRTLDYATIEGLQLQVQAFREGGQLWVRVKAATDPATAQAWAKVSAANAASNATLETRVVAFNKSFEGRRFLLADPVATNLLLTHEQILAGPPKP